MTRLRTLFDHALPHPPRHLETVLAGLVAVLGLGIVLGWILPWRWLATLLPGAAPAPASAGLCFLVLAVALWALARDRGTLARAAGGVVASVGVAVIVGFLTRPLEPGAGVVSMQRLQQVLMPVPMAPNTALCLLILALALVLAVRVNSSRRRTLILFLSSLAIAIAVVGLFAQLSGLRAAFSWGSHTPMAVPSSLALLLAGVVLWIRVHLRRRSGEGRGSPSIALWMAAASTLVLVAAVAVAAHRQQAGSARRVAQTHEVIAHLGRIELATADLESSLRGQLLADALDRPDLQQQAKHLRDLVRDLQNSFEPQSEQARWAAHLQAELNQSFAQLRAQLHESPGLAVPAVSAAVRPWTQQILAVEQSSLEGRVQRRHQAQVDAEGVILLGSTLALLFFAAAMVAMRRSEHQRAQLGAERLLSERRFRGAFDHAGIGMAIRDLDGRWIMVNRRLREILGYSADELRQKRFSELTHPDDRRLEQEHFRDLLQGSRNFYRIEKRYRHADGHLVWANVTVALVRDEAGKPVHFVTQLEDISERKELESVSVNN
jgi:PAS domain S-box-containing protein